MLEKISLNIQDVLTRSTGKTRSKHCRSRLVSFANQQGLYRFRVICGEERSKAAGHEVNIWLEKDDGIPHGRLEFKANCDCRSWKFWGADNHARAKDYLLGSPKSNGATPTKRDPGTENLVCKHVYACLSDLLKRNLIQ